MSDILAHIEISSEHLPLSLTDGAHLALMLGMLATEYEKGEHRNTTRIVILDSAAESRYTRDRA